MIRPLNMAGVIVAAGALALAALNGCAAPAPRTCALTPLAVGPSGGVLPGGRIDFGEADDPKAPTAWQGPVSITKGARTCKAPEAVSLLEMPAYAGGDQTVMLSTYSGSEQQLVLISQKDCGVIWKSRPFVGTVSYKAPVLSAGNQTFKIGPDCRVDASGKR